VIDRDSLFETDDNDDYDDADGDGSDDVIIDVVDEDDDPQHNPTIVISYRSCDSWTGKLNCRRICVF